MQHFSGAKQKKSCLPTKSDLSLSWDSVMQVWYKILVFSFHTSKLSHTVPTPHQRGSKNYVLTCYLASKMPGKECVPFGPSRWNFPNASLSSYGQRAGQTTSWSAFKNTQCKELQIALSPSLFCSFLVTNHQIEKKMQHHFRNFASSTTPILSLFFNRLNYHFDAPFHVITTENENSGRTCHSAELSHFRPMKFVQTCWSDWLQSLFCVTSQIEYNSCT